MEVYQPDVHTKILYDAKFVLKDVDLGSMVFASPKGLLHLTRVKSGQGRDVLLKIP
jgi:hypothetical protein